MENSKKRLHGKAGPEEGRKKMELRKKLTCFAEKFRGQVKEAAVSMFSEEIPPVTEELFGLYETTGNRLSYEKVYFRRRKFLAVFGLEALAQREENGSVEQHIVGKLDSVIREVCNEECWALPPHVNRKEKEWAVTVDLFAAETAQTLSDLAENLEDVLSCETKSLIMENVERRVFTPYFTSTVPYRRWENSMHNWNGVCAGAIGSACLYLIKDKIRLKTCLTRICNSLEYYLKGFEEDGTCTEGLGYYNYGMSYFCNFAQELYDRTDGEYDLFNGAWGEAPKAEIAAFAAKCFFEDGRTVSFADGSSRGRFRMGLECVLAMHYSPFTFPDVKRAADLDTDGCYRFTALKMDLQMPGRMLACYKKNCLQDMIGREEKFSEKINVLPKAQWVIARSANGVGMACKGGHNMEFHNHNDVGHFIYEGMGTLFLTDLGAGEYKKGYFGEGRYQVLCNRSMGHSVPLINGKEQPEGKEYRCRDFQVQSGEKTVAVRMDLADAYESREAVEIIRRLEFDLTNGLLKVTDDFTLYGKPGERVQENLVTQIPPVVEKNRILFQDESATCILTFPGNDGFAGKAVRILEYEHDNHKGVKEKVYALRWDVPLIQGQGCSEMEISVKKCIR